ncbi:hypothetical protein Aduo_003316 [Ancylostoma duodenale]
MMQPSEVRTKEKRNGKREKKKDGEERMKKSPLFLWSNYILLYIPYPNTVWACKEARSRKQIEEESTLNSTAINTARSINGWMKEQHGRSTRRPYVSNAVKCVRREPEMTERKKTHHCKF